LTNEAKSAPATILAVACTTDTTIAIPKSAFMRIHRGAICAFNVKRLAESEADRHEHEACPVGQQRWRRTKPLAVMAESVRACPTRHQPAQNREAPTHRRIDPVIETSRRDRDHRPTCGIVRLPAWPWPTSGCRPSIGKSAATPIHVGVRVRERLVDPKTDPRTPARPVASISSVIPSQRERPRGRWLSQPLTRELQETLSPIFGLHSF
jgi:hypothetical protein